MQLAVFVHERGRYRVGDGRCAGFRIVVQFQVKDGNSKLFVCPCRQAAIGAFRSVEGVFVRVLASVHCLCVNFRDCRCLLLELAVFVRAIGEEHARVAQSVDAVHRECGHRLPAANHGGDCARLRFGESELTAVCFVFGIQTAFVVACAGVFPVAVVVTIEVDVVRVSAEVKNIARAEQSLPLVQCDAGERLDADFFKQFRLCFEKTFHDGENQFRSGFGDVC